MKFDDKKYTVKEIIFWSIVVGAFGWFLGGAFFGGFMTTFTFGFLYYNHRKDD